MDPVLAHPTCPDLHDKFGRAFEEAYVRYEEKAARGEIKLFKQTARAQTCGARCCPCCSRPAIPGSPSRTRATSASPQQHVGVVHSSNLCTEITLNTSEDEIAVCNLGSVNLVNH